MAKARKISAQRNVPAGKARPAADETHYVLVIHGTFNAPQEGEHKWYQQDENRRNFCRRLNDALHEGPLGSAVWRQCGGRPLTFHWSGGNKDRDRDVAASDLTN